MLAANGCLRLSAGHVESYQAADAVQHTPITTLAGLVDKHIEASLTQASGPIGGPVDALHAAGEFDCPARLVELCSADPAVAKTPVCLLYSTDTVGGNSGSPVLDADYWPCSSRAASMYSFASPFVPSQGNSSWESAISATAVRMLRLARGPYCDAAADRSA